jgi:hypothetical protein
VGGLGFGLGVLTTLALLHLLSIVPWSTDRVPADWKTMRLNRDKVRMKVPSAFQHRFEEGALVLNYPDDPLLTIHVRTSFIAGSENSAEALVRDLAKGRSVTERRGKTFLTDVRATDDAKGQWFIEWEWKVGFGRVSVDILAKIPTRMSVGELLAQESMRELIEETIPRMIGSLQRE